MTVSGPNSRSDGDSEGGSGSPNRNRTDSAPNTVPPAAVSPNTVQQQAQPPRRRISSAETPDAAVDADALIENFPLAKLQKLDELISNPRWVIPVLPKGELEVLLDYSIKLTRAGADKNCQPCQRFYREGLLISFTKIMTDEAVSSWRHDIQVSQLFASSSCMDRQPQRSCGWKG
jgi:ubiquitin carboxyl-terminal hydrolase 9/24